MKGDLNDVELDDEDLIELATQDGAGGWGKLPRVLARLNHPVSQLPKSTLDKTTRVCGSCYSMFADVQEMELHEHQQTASRRATAAHRSGTDASSFFTGTRLPDPATDFVMLGNHDAMRLRHEQRREKEKLRAMLHERMQGIDWKELPQTGHAAREVVAVVRDGQAGLQALQDPTTRQRRAKRYGNLKARHASADVDLSEDIVDFTPSPALALPMPPATPAASSPARPHPPAGRLNFSPMSLAGTIVDQAPNDEETERLLTSFVNDAHVDNVFDLPLSHTLMYELWASMTTACRFSRDTHTDLEDVPQSDAHFHVYSHGRLRFEDPPSVHIDMPWLPPKAAAAPASEAPSQANTPTKAAPSPSRGAAQEAPQAPPSPAAAPSRVKSRDALAGSTKVVTELSGDELKLLAKVVGHGDDPGPEPTLTDRDMRIIDGQQEGSGDDAMEESDPFDDYDDEEGSEFDSFISDGEGPGGGDAV